MQFNLNLHPGAVRQAATKRVAYYQLKKYVKLYNKTGPQGQIQKQSLTVKVDLFMRQVGCERPI